MCRLLGYCSHDPASLASLMGDQGFAEFTALSSLHQDGWGMAWYDGSEPVIRKSPGRAGDEPEYEKLAWQPLGDLGLLHLRWATPGLPVEDRNTHPFRRGSFIFAHNGAIHPQSRLPELLPADWERRVNGTTDSERYFLHLMWRLEERGGDMLAAIADTTADIEERYAPNSLNAILLSPDAAVRDLLARPGQGARAAAAGPRVRRPAGRDRLLLRPRLPRRRGRRGGGQLRLAEAGLDAAAALPRPEGRPGHAGHLGDRTAGRQASLARQREADYLWPNARRTSTTTTMRPTTMTPWLMTMPVSLVRAAVRTCRG